MSAPATVARESSAVPPPAPSAVRTPWLDISVAGLLAGAAVAILVAFRREPVFSDDLGYWLRWESLGERSGMANHYRLGMVLSAQLARVVVGDSLWGYNSVGIAYGAGLVVVVYVLTRLLFPKVVALGSAVLLLTSPVFLEDITLTLPDWPSMFWFGAGFALLVYAATRQDDPRRQTVAAVLAGACFFLMAWVKDGSVPILVAVPVCMLLITDVRRAVRLTLTAAGTSMLFLVLEFGLLAAIYGEPFRRLRIILTGHVGGRTSEALGGRVERQGAPPSGVEADLLTWGDLAERYVDPISRTASGRWILALAGLALVVTLVSRSKRLWFLAAPTLVGLGFVVFGVGSIQPLVPLLSMKFRYLSLGWVFLMPLIAASLWVLTRWIAEQVGAWVGTTTRAVSGVAATVVVVSVGMMAFAGLSDAAARPVFIRSGEDGLHQTAQLIEELRAADVPFNGIVTDGRTLNGLSVKLPPREIELIEGASSDLLGASPGDLVVVNRKRIGHATFPASGGRNRPLDEALLIPPPNWRLVGQTDIQNFRIYYVEDPAMPAASLASLTTSGETVTSLARAYQLGDDAPGVLVEQRGPGGLLLWLEDAEVVRLVTGAGGHTRPPRGGDEDVLSVSQRGRLGVMVELHVEPGAEIRGMFLRTYGADGELLQNSRMYQVTEDDRTSEAGFVTTGRSVSFADHVDVDPANETTFRVVGFLEGTGAVTVDRIAFQLVPTD